MEIHGSLQTFWIFSTKRMLYLSPDSKAELNIHVFLYARLPMSTWRTPVDGGNRFLGMEVHDGYNDCETDWLKPLVLFKAEIWVKSLLSFACYRLSCSSPSSLRHRTKKEDRETVRVPVTLRTSVIYFWPPAGHTPILKSVLLVPRPQSHIISIEIYRLRTVNVRFNSPVVALH